jgi:hypothetical protein
MAFKRTGVEREGLGAQELDNRVLDAENWCLTATIPVSDCTAHQPRSEVDRSKRSDTDVITCGAGKAPRASTSNNANHCVPSLPSSISPARRLQI